MITLSVNGEAYTLDIEPDMPLLWALRDVMQLTGTKYGCGIAMCGACTVQVDGAAVRACVTPVSSVEGKQITTIEKISSPAAKAVQDAWLKHEVVQCGYCQSGQIMSAIGSQRNCEARRQRLHELGLSPAAIRRLHAPVGLDIGSHTPPEIAVAILAEITARRNSATNIVRDNKAVNVA